MNYKPSTLVVLVWIMHVTSCSPKMISTIEGANYDRKMDVTKYIVVPYGAVTMPGKWEKGKYVPISRQQYFKKDSVELSVAFGAVESFEFFKRGLREFAFVKAYYEWESTYQAKNLKQNIQFITADSVNNYIMWRTYSDKADIITLSAFRNCNCDAGAFQNFTINAVNGEQDAKVRFLKDLYFGKISH